MSKSPYKVRPPASLKGATSELVSLCGGQEAAADALGVTKGSVFRWTDDSEENAGRSISAHAVRILERRCGEPVVTRLLAAEAGCALVDLAAAESEGLPLGVKVARYAEETSASFGKLVAALADGVVTPAEAREAIVALDQAQTVGAALRARLRGIVRLGLVEPGDGAAQQQGED